MKRDWLEARLAESPEPLRLRLESVIAELDADGDPAVSLLEAARRTLSGIGSRVHERATAFDLLLADGLLTLACEAAARSDPDGLPERCRAMGPGGHLGELVRDRTGGG
jgi:hypothetical protein